MLKKIKKNYFEIISFFLIIYFLINLLGGQRGLFSYFEKKETLKKLTNEETVKLSKIKRLELENSLLTDNIDKDFAALDGNVKSSGEFSHNNMVPFFGGRMSGANVNNSGIYETVLDNLQGSGSQLIEKREVGTFFTPESNIQHTH